MADGPIFTPEVVQRYDPSRLRRRGRGPDERTVYVYHDERIKLAVNVALATGRPLLLSGDPGCGKSSLALSVALALGWRYYEKVITARSEARDLMWQFDTIRRLNDAQAQQLRPDEAYVQPGPLWWAFNRESASRRGAREELPKEQFAVDPCETVMADTDHAVVLIDEIDKADPDLPNELLVPLGALHFTVDQTNFAIEAVTRPMIIITTNRERELPQAFVRRCVALELPRPTKDTLLAVGRAVIPAGRWDEALGTAVAELVLKLANEEEQSSAGRGPSTAEFLDTVWACLELHIGVRHRDFEALTSITLRKRHVAGEV